MTIAFDIDGTWSLEPDAFFAFAEDLRNRGWRVVIATGAIQPPDKLERLKLNSWPIVYTGNQLKEKALRDAGYSVNVWVDDMPGVIQNTRILNCDED